MFASNPGTVHWISYRVSLMFNRRAEGTEELGKGRWKQHDNYLLLIK
jgi:hypothetical protein